MRVAQALCLLSIICDEEVRQIVQIRFIYPDWVRWLLEEKTGHYARRPSLRMCGPLSGDRAKTALCADWPKSVQGMLNGPRAVDIRFS